jgi:hypothetical protein
MNIDQAFPSNYLKSSDVPGDPGEGELVYTITNVKVEDMGQDEDAERKPVLYFREIDKGMVLNKTNASVVKGLYGPETDDWTGERVTIYIAEVTFQGRLVPALRIRSRKPKTSATASGNGHASATSTTLSERETAFMDWAKTHRVNEDNREALAKKVLDLANARGLPLKGDSVQGQVDYLRGELEAAVLATTADVPF